MNKNIKDILTYNPITYCICDTICLIIKFLSYCTDKYRDNTIFNLSINSIFIFMASFLGLMFLGLKPDDAFGLTVALSFCILFGSFVPSGKDIPIIKENKKEYIRENTYNPKHTPDRAKMFKADYYLKGYPNIVREIVCGDNVYEVICKYKADPKVKRLLRVVEVSK